MGDVMYCDNYEELTGRERDGSMPNEPAPGEQSDAEQSDAEQSGPQAKVITSPSDAKPANATTAETK